MTADSDLFVSETVCLALKQKIRKLVPKNHYIYLGVPSETIRTTHSSLRV